MHTGMMVGEEVLRISIREKRSDIFSVCVTNNFQSVLPSLTQLLRHCIGYLLPPSDQIVVDGRQIRRRQYHTDTGDSRRASHRERFRPYPRHIPLSVAQIGDPQPVDK